MKRLLHIFWVFFQIGLFTIGGGYAMLPVIQRQVVDVQGWMTDEEFFRLWTAREATVKRRGQGIAALMRGEAPDPLCRCLPDLLPGWVVTVCPSVDAPVRALRMEGSDDESRDQPPK